MQRFTEFDILFVHKQDEVLESLGLDNKGEDYIDKGSFDLNEVESFMPCSDKFKDKDMTRAQLKSGDLFSVVMPYDEFKQLMIK